MTRRTPPITAPVRVVNESPLQWYDWVMFALLSIASWTAIVHFFIYWCSLPDWYQAPVTFAIITLLVLDTLAINQGHWFMLLSMQRPQPMAPRRHWRVGVATTFVPGAESLHMLHDTVTALVGMDYPHDTWVLDEGDDDQVKALCAELGAYHFSRKHLPQYQTESGTFQSHFKHGNYNAWLHEIGFERYEIVSGFDPDHVPRLDFLSKVIGYFEDPWIGYVQAAPVYYNQQASFIARGAAEETYAYVSTVQMANHGLGYPIVIGSHNTHRVTALKEVGGFAPHAADDLLITLLYRDHGWQGVYVPEVLARGLTPTDWPGYLAQQRRWARSVLDIKIRLYPKISRNLHGTSRLMSLLHGIGYVQGGITTFVWLALLAYMLMSGYVPGVVSEQGLTRVVLLLAVLHAGVFYRQRFYLNWYSERGMHWRVMLLRYAKWPYLLLALGDVLFGNQPTYTITPKQRTGTSRQPNMLLFPHLLVAVGISVAWLAGISCQGRLHPFLHTCSALVVLGSCGLILTHYGSFPEPFLQRDTAVSHSVPPTAPEAD